jgi:hypothetical protein
MPMKIMINTIGGGGSDFTSFHTWEASTDIGDVFRVLLVDSLDKIEEKFQQIQRYLQNSQEDSLIITGTGQMLWGRLIDQSITLAEAAELSIKELKIFESDEKPDLLIWRYLSFLKFMSMLYEKSLYFARGDTFDDQYEGSFPKVNIDRIRESAEDSKRLQQFLHNLYEHGRQWTYVSCWHASDIESPAMWDKYGENGVCIQSTVRKLRSCLNDQARVFQTRYIDYEIDRIPITHLFHPFLHKRKYFEYEKEVRVLTFKPEDKPESGLHVKLELPELIEHIFVHPSSATWFFDLVKKIAGDHGLDENKVIRSELNNAPFYTTRSA